MHLTTGRARSVQRTKRGEGVERNKDRKGGNKGRVRTEKGLEQMERQN